MEQQKQLTLSRENLIDISVALCTYIKDIDSWYDRTNDTYWLERKNRVQEALDKVRDAKNRNLQSG